MDADAELLHPLVMGCGLMHPFHNLERAEATLRHHVITIEDRHQAISAELINIATVEVDQVHLHCKLSTDQREQFIGLYFFGQSGEAADIREKNYNFALDG